MTKPPANFGNDKLSRAMCSPKKTIFIAVLPQDYSHADVELFETRGEAEQYVKDNSIRGDTQYCKILEREVLFQ